MRKFTIYLNLYFNHRKIVNFPVFAFPAFAKNKIFFEKVVFNSEKITPHKNLVKKLKKLI